MPGPGHVFVVHGSLPHLVCDVALIPTAGDAWVESTWRRYCPREPGGPPDDLLDATRAAFVAGHRVGPLAPADGGRPAFRYVDVGIGHGHDFERDSERRALTWLDEGVTEALAAVSADVDAGALRGRRERPLVALPAFGTGQGGFGTVRGEVSETLLRRCEQAVLDGGFDIAVVCFTRADFAFLQSRRRAVGQDALEAGAREQALELGRLAGARELSLFLGAGVSVAAGAPDFATLVRRVGALLGHDVDAATPAQAAEQAQRLREAVGGPRLKAAVADVLDGSGASLLHGLLASLRTDAVMTTNFDDLFELSAQVAQPTPPDVLPWQRHRRAPWLLKLHGSLGHDGDLVITTEDLSGFNARERPLAAVVQAQLLLRQVLFVGYSLHDLNVQELAEGVRDLLAQQGPARQTVGTVLAVEPLDAGLTGLSQALDVVDLSDGSGVTPAAARRLEVFCDVVLWEATRDEPAWQLDDRYALEGDDRAVRDQLRALRLPDGDTWRRLRRVLSDYGLQ